MSFHQFLQKKKNESWDLNLRVISGTRNLEVSQPIPWGTNESNNRGGVGSTRSISTTLLTLMEKVNIWDIAHDSCAFWFGLTRG